MVMSDSLKEMIHYFLYWIYEVVTKTVENCKIVPVNVLHELWMNASYRLYCSMYDWDNYS